MCRARVRDWAAILIRGAGAKSLDGQIAPHFRYLTDERCLGAMIKFR